LTFTSVDWNMAQTVTVTGVDDPSVDGDQVTTITLAVDDDNSDDDYDPLPDQSVAVTTNDDEAAGFTVAETGGTAVSESGSTDTFSVVLDDQPLTNVVINVGSGDTGEATIDKAALTFTPSNWDTAQIVTVTGVDDPTVDGDQATTITLSVDDDNSDDAFDPLADQTVSVTTTDDDSASFTVAVTDGNTTVSEDGSTDTFSVVLDRQPLTNVVINVGSGDTGEATIDKAVLTFTPSNWDTAQTVSVTGVDDPTVDGDQATTITLAVDDDNSDDAFDPLADQTISVTTTDDDVAGFALSEMTVTVAEAGTTETFTVVLTAQPLSNVVINVASGNTAEVTVDSASLTFANVDWDQPQTVTVTAVNNDNQDTIISLSIDDTASDDAFDSLSAQTVTVTRNVALDFGDAPTAVQSGFAGDYPTTLAHDGARHVVGSLFLGEQIDAELNGQPTAASDGDDNNRDSDEDGVSVVGSIVATNASSTASSFAVTASASGRLDAWIDFNQDGDWDDSGEQIITNEVVAEGINVLGFDVPAGTTPGNTGARFRLSSAGRLTPTGVALDGEVEDTIVTILDGNTASGVAIEINPGIPGTLEVVADGSEIVVRSGAIELFRGPGSALGSFDFIGTSGDDTLNLANLDAVFGGSVGGNAGDGNDTLRLTGSDQDLDLTHIDTNIQELETIDIIGNGNNTLTLDVDEVLNMSDSSDDLIVLSNLYDTVNVGAGWKLTGAQVVDGTYFRVLEQGGATLLLNGPANWQNPVNRHDVNNNGVLGDPVGDILSLINELNKPQFISPNGALPGQPVDGNLPTWSYDINGDGFLTPVGDILSQINFVNSGAGQEGEGGVALDVPFPFGAIFVTPATDRALVNSRIQATPAAVRLAALRPQMVRVVPFVGASVISNRTRSPNVSAVDRLLAESLDDLVSDASDLNDHLDELLATEMVDWF